MTARTAARVLHADDEVTAALGRYRRAEEARDRSELPESDHRNRRRLKDDVHEAEHQLRRAHECRAYVIARDFELAEYLRSDDHGYPDLDAARYELYRALDHLAPAVVADLRAGVPLEWVARRLVAVTDPR